MSSAKRDIKQTEKHLYYPSTKEVAVVDIPAAPFLMIDGVGDPNTALAYQQAVEALFSVAYTLKFLLKQEQGMDYVVAPLEGLWWTPDMREFSVDNKAGWHWTLMIRQPAEVTQDLFGQGVAKAQRKKDILATPLLRLEWFHEGLAGQIMHVGPFITEGPTIAKLHAYIQEQRYALRGKHHEIYLSDPRRTAPEKLRTVIRQPIEMRAETSSVATTGALAATSSGEMTL